MVQFVDENRRVISGSFINVKTVYIVAGLQGKRGLIVLFLHLTDGARLFASCFNMFAKYYGFLTFLCSMLNTRCLKVRHCYFILAADVITIEKTGENFRLIYDVKGRFTIHRISNDEAKVCWNLNYSVNPVIGLIEDGAVVFNTCSCSK